MALVSKADCTLSSCFGSPFVHRNEQFRTVVLMPVCGVRAAVPEKRVFTAYADYDRRFVTSCLYCALANVQIQYRSGVFVRGEAKYYSVDLQATI